MEIFFNKSNKSFQEESLIDSLQTFHLNKTIFFQHNQLPTAIVCLKRNMKTAHTRKIGPGK